MGARVLPGEGGAEQLMGKPTTTMTTPIDEAKDMTAPNDEAKDMSAPNDEAEDMSAPNDEAEGMSAPNDEDQWSQEDMLTLLETMKSLLPGQDSSYFKTTESHLDWNKLAFKNYTGSMCHQKWTEISNKVRKFRTLTELIQDAEEHVMNPYKGKNLKKHPEFPKKPLTPYYRFLMEKKAKYAKLYPEISHADFTRILSKKYKELPEQKKRKYIQDCQLEKQDFERSLARFREGHLGLSQNPQKCDIPEKPKTPQQLWYDHKRTVYLKQKPDASSKDVKDALGKQWSQLSDKKRLKWIHKALEQQKLYQNTMREFIQEHPEMNISEDYISHSTLTKAERQLKNKFDGRPTKPPPNSYSMYCAELMASLKDVPGKERMALCSQQWKLLSQQDKDAHHKKSVQKKEEYQLELMRFLKTLPEEEQERVLAEERMVGLNKKVTSSHASKLAAQEAAKAKDRSEQPGRSKAADETSNLPEPAQTAEELWQQNVIGEYLAQCKNDQAKALESMEITWMKMEKKDKIAWIKKAAQDYKRYERELSNIKSASVTTFGGKKVKLQEPDKAPIPSSQEQVFYIKMNSSKRRSTSKLKRPKSKVASQNKSNEEKVEVHDEEESPQEIDVTDD